ncbi:MAG: metalloregulator ArsR/SmtB family transcription factor [Proteobacteria bacterium]|nr:metalloregulator ArsR/SmtB family transcription factor [Pseudomonadota bacterium]MBU1388794.1 metalloregulator ArsR/SmtB family transcription factor [Pseudomonadota bacterium]MBU1543135.1 metalloregulator ArsR/SmtB family transcription factor [Pseudomonadota bacterium]MBU2431659.1 metalloregulator ArsR/SmtB family transcription factor [Pseudomonadota bacterium]MBU2481725.1 metalloregulator ArsR/SmtB family transcription factor [Pseudomonadota bacterium]
MELIKCFKALSDITRLRLLSVLNTYELNVNEIVLVVDMIQSGVSRHLKILVESGLLTSRKDGSFTYYCAVKNEQVNPLIAFVEKHLEKEGDFVLQDLTKAQEMIRVRQNKTRRFFKTIAPQWDGLKKEVLGNFDLNAVLQKKISLQGNIADLGCGTGELIQTLVCPTVKKLIGVDSSPEMLEQARLRLSRTSAQLRLGELEHLPMKNRQMDTVIMNMVLHYISQPDRSISEAFRVLKPGGLFILSDFEKHTLEKMKQVMGGSWLGFEKEDVNAWMIQAGFRLDTVESFPVNHGLVINVFAATKIKMKR